LSSSVLQLFGLNCLHFSTAETMMTLYPSSFFSFEWRHLQRNVGVVKIAMLPSRISMYNSSASAPTVLIIQHRHPTRQASFFPNHLGLVQITVYFLYVLLQRSRKLNCIRAMIAQTGRSTASRCRRPYAQPLNYETVLPNLVSHDLIISVMSWLWVKINGSMAEYSIEDPGSNGKVEGCRARNPTTNIDAFLGRNNFSDEQTPMHMVSEWRQVNS
jgi:hypothetical protein